jgi:hypothetical protein
MRTNFQRIISILTIFLLGSCGLPGSEQSTFELTDTPNVAPATITVEPSQNDQSVDCAFIWAKKPLPNLSESFDQTLKEALPNAGGYAEAYGENCVTETGEIARFLAMETDFHITLSVEDLEDQQMLGNLIEDVMTVLSAFPTEDIPGPQPGYIGLTFETPNDSIRLWIMRTDIEAALERGLQGEKLFTTLQNK